MDSFRLIRQSMAIALGLFVIKAGAGLASGSLSVLASALDSLLDLCSSAVNLVSLGIARSPADDEHPYGHGKAEALAGLFQGAFIGLGGLALMAESIRRFVQGVGMDFNPWALGVMGISTVISVLHGHRLHQAAHAEDSRIMAAEGAHFLSDVAANLGVIGALLLVRFTGNSSWDLAVTMMVSTYVLAITVPIMKRSIADLMDVGLPEDLRAEVESIIKSHHPSIGRFHNFRSRCSGTRRYIEFHVEIKGVSDFRQAHEITESLTGEIRSRIPNSDVIIHYDPEGAHRH